MSGIVDRCLSLCTFFFGHCVVCSSSIYDSDCPFGIFKIYVMLQCILVFFLFIFFLFIFFLGRVHLEGSGLLGFVCLFLFFVWFFLFFISFYFFLLFLFLFLFGFFLGGRWGGGYPFILLAPLGCERHLRPFESSI